MKPKNILSLACGVFGLAATCPAELVAHYKFDEATGAALAADELGTAPGAVGYYVVTGVPGIAGNAYQFGGFYAEQDDIVDMGNAAFFPAIVASGRMSFSVWVKTSDTTGNRNTVIFAGDSTVSNVYADLGVAAGQTGALGAASARNRPSGAPGAQQTGIYSTPAVPPVNDGQWHHLAMTVDLAAATLALYVDGVAANTQTMTAAAFPAFNNFEIGRLGRSSPVDPFEGLIDDVQVYDHALTAEEVRYLFANPGLHVIPAPPDLAITSAAIDGADFRITFTGAPSSTYNVRGSLDLQTFDIDEGTAATDGSGAGIATIPLVPGRPRQFYRIERAAAP